MQTIKLMNGATIHPSVTMVELTAKELITSLLNCITRQKMNRMLQIRANLDKNATAFMDPTISFGRAGKARLIFHKLHAKTCKSSLQWQKTTFFLIGLPTA